MAPLPILAVSALSVAQPTASRASTPAASAPAASAPAASAPAASAPASSPASAASYGLIWLDVDPGAAEVSLDGDFLDAGVWLISVSPGEHDVRIRKTGFRAYAGRVSVPPGGSVHLDVRLQPGPAGDS